MRKKLAAHKNERKTFVGTYVRKGHKGGWVGSLETILLADIRIDGEDEILTDHAWFNYTKGFQSLGTIRPGATIRFDARVTGYTKGYQGRRSDVYNPVSRDFKLSHPTKIEIVEQGPVQDISSMEWPRS